MTVPVRPVGAHEGDVRVVGEQRLPRPHRDAQPGQPLHERDRERLGRERRLLAASAGEHHDDLTGRPDLVEGGLRGSGADRGEEPRGQQVVQDLAADHGRRRRQALRQRLGRELGELLRGRRGLPHDRRELLLRRRVLRDELVGRRHGRQDARAGVGQRRLRLREHLVLDPRLRDQHDRRPGQLPGREVGHDRIREPVQRGHLVAQVADLLRPVIQIVAEAIGLVLELLLQRRLHERRATQEPDREREEDRDDRHDVVSERDHSSSFRSNSH